MIIDLSILDITSQQFFSSTKTSYNSEAIPITILSLAFHHLTHQQNPYIQKI